MSENRITFEGGSVVDPGFKCSKCGEPFKATVTIHDTRTDRLEQDNADLKRLIRWSYEKNTGWHLLDREAPEFIAIEKLVREK